MAMPASSPSSPGDLLDEQGVAPGDERDGVRFARNTCPSQGTMDVFVEPVLPRPEIVVCGSSPVAVAIADLGKRLGFAMTACAPTAEQGAFVDVERRIEGYALPVEHEGHRYIVISTQSRGDEAALQAALAVDADYVAFVGSRRKVETLKAKLTERGVDPDRIAKLKAPAGLDLGETTTPFNGVFEFAGTRLGFGHWKQALCIRPCSSSSRVV